MRTSVKFVIISLIWLIIPMYAYAEEDVHEVRVCAVGNNIIHKRVIESGINDDGTRDYTDIYKYYKNYLEDYDVRAVNQETVFVENEDDFSAYPKFGGPKEVGSALMDAGFNVITTATNHALDKGVYTLVDSHRFWTNWGIDPVGTYVYDKMYDTDTHSYVDYHAVFMRKNDITFGFLNYTDSTNGIELPEEYSYMLATMDDREFIKSEMEWAKGKCDILIVFPHWGHGYVTTPTLKQCSWAKFFADNGADVIIGTGPNVVQPLEYVTAGNGKSVPCYYSLGNFLSNQNKTSTMLGAASTFTVRKSGSDVSVLDVKAVPVVTHISYYSEKFNSIALQDYSEEDSYKHRLRRVEGEMFSINRLWEIWYEVFSEDQTGKF